MCLRCQRGGCQCAEKVGRSIWFATVGSFNSFAFPFPNRQWQLIVDNCMKKYRNAEQQDIPCCNEVFLLTHIYHKIWSVTDALVHYELVVW